MARPRLDDPRTEDIRLKVSKKKWAEWIELKKGTAFEDSTIPEFAYHLMMLGDLNFRQREELLSRRDNAKTEASPEAPKERKSPLDLPKMGKLDQEKEESKKTSGE